jgi:hypothetical protein
MTFLLALAAATAPAAPYPTAAVLEAFRGACENLTSRAATKVRLVKQGWREVTLDKGTPLSDLLAFGLEEGAKAAAKDGARVAPYSVHERVVAGETLSLIMSGLIYEGTYINGCRMYDVGEMRSIPLAEAEAWMGRKADQSQAKPELSAAIWRPGFDRQYHLSFQLFHVPDGSPAVALLKVTGIALVADHIAIDDSEGK